MSRNNLSYAYYMYCLLGQWHCARADNFDWDDWDECTISSHVIFLFYIILPFITSYHKKSHIKCVGCSARFFVSQTRSSTVKVRYPF